MENQIWKKEVNIIKNITQWCKIIYQEENSLKTFIQQVSIKISPNPTPINDFYKSHFNNIGLLDKYQSGVEEKKIGTF